jgi:hypothetical protein
MRIRSFRPSSRRPESAWPSRLAWVVIGVAAVLFIVIAARNLRRQDALTEWRQGLEIAANRPAWPPWSNAWPPLPDPPRRRHQLPQELHGVYAYAATHPEVLSKIPCYCGCVREGHRSNLNCLVTGFRSDGTPIWTDHSFSCPMCVHIAREVMLMSARGLSVGRIREEIEAHYHDQGSPTNTPVPTEVARHQW